MTLKSLEVGWINWEELLAPADGAGDIEAALARAAYRLAQSDARPAPGLMLLFPAGRRLPVDPRRLACSI